MLRLLTYLCVCLICGAVPVAAGVKEVVQTIEKSRIENCKLPEQGVDQLISEISASSDEVEQALGLQVLSQQVMWRAQDQAAALEAINTVGAKSQTLELLAARALEVAAGELRAAGLKPPDEYEAYLRQLIDKTAGGNRFYHALAQATLAETLQDWVFRDNQAANLPLTSLTELDKVRLDEVIGLYAALRDFYGPLSRTTNLFSRDLTLDFEYQIALLKFAAAHPDWAEILQDIIDTEGEKNPYDRAQEARHVYVYSFLRPPLREIEEVVPSSAFGRNKACSAAAQSGPTKVVRQTSDAIVQQFYNPAQLAAWTCAKLSAPPERFAVNDLVLALRGFQIHDYRVVLGHYRGQQVRYSYFSLPELEELAQEMQATIAKEFRPGSELTHHIEGARCTTPTAMPGLTLSLDIGNQSDDASRGYIYLGDGLTRDDAKRLLLLVTSFEDFSNAYLIRPKIN